MTARPARGAIRRTGRTAAGRRIPTNIVARDPRRRRSATFRTLARRRRRPTASSTSCIRACWRAASSATAGVVRLREQRLGEAAGLRLTVVDKRQLQAVAFRHRRHADISKSPYVTARDVGLPFARHAAVSRRLGYRQFRAAAANDACDFADRCGLRRLPRLEPRDQPHGSRTAARSTSACRQLATAARKDCAARPSSASICHSQRQDGRHQGRAHQVVA